MAYFQGVFRSKVLQMDTAVNVAIPYDYYDDCGRPGRYDRVLYLLHGLKQNADAWPRMSGAERYANYHGYALVMPEVQRSFYTDMAFGPRYFTYLTEELPAVISALYRLPTDRAHTFVGGLSMGGYGAMKCALTRPDLFAGAMCFSSGFYMLDDPDWLGRAYYSKAELAGVIGSELRRAPADDLERAMDAFPKDQKRPRLYVACGTEDPLYQKSARMRDALRARGFAPEYEEWPGAHDWTFWDAALQKGMAYMAAE